MKMIIAVVQNVDAPAVIRQMARGGFGVTKLASTGGFLRDGNSTLLIGTEDEKVDAALEIIKAECAGRKQVIPNVSHMAGVNESPFEDKLGGASIFVMDI